MTLDPVVEALLARMGQLSADGPPTADRVIEGRPLFDQLTAASASAPRPDVSVTDVMLGAIPARLYRPLDEKGPLPLHVYYHGGAFMLGSALSGAQDADLAERAHAARCVVASVEYRLAPEHRFPSGIEDSYQALVVLHERAGELGIDAETVTIGGVSSGGNFAAVVAQLCVERRGPELQLQLLEIAGTDLTKSSAAWRTPAPGHDTTREADLHLIDLYLNDVSERALPIASPLFRPDLRGVAPAYVMNAELDPRRDECEAYVTRLTDAGVPAIARTMEGHIHGSMTLPDWPPAIAWRQEANDVLARAHSRSLEWIAPSPA